MVITHYFTKFELISIGAGFHYLKILQQYCISNVEIVNPGLLAPASRVPSGSASIGFVIILNSQFN